eukprot:g3840.t1
MSSTRSRKRLSNGSIKPSSKSEWTDDTSTLTSSSSSLSLGASFSIPAASKKRKKKLQALGIFSDDSKISTATAAAGARKSEKKRSRLDISNIKQGEDSLLLYMKNVNTTPPTKGKETGKVDEDTYYSAFRSAIGKAASKTTPTPTSPSARGLGILRDDGDDQISRLTTLTSSRSALDILKEKMKRKELKKVDHSLVEYSPFRKKFYVPPPSLSSLSGEDVQTLRRKMKIRIRGRRCPAPVETWQQCGLSPKVQFLLRRSNFARPFPIQQQAIPALMSGRDVLGIAKTGSGKTLAFLLPVFRHILDQPRIKESEGPIALILAPARELCVQIHNEAKKFCKVLGLRAAAVYGGTSVSEQIAALKRGTDIVTCTPGRFIDILTMNAGRLLSLQRCTFLVLDE